MPRPAAEQAEAINPDSFLDIVASVVSIMIIMVVMEGSRIRNAPVDPKTLADTPEMAAAMEKGEAAERGVRGEILKTAREIQVVGAQAALRKQERDALATVVTALEQKVALRRQALDAPTQEQFDLTRKLGDAQVERNRLQAQARESLDKDPPPTEIACYGSAISKTVEADEVHLRLRAGRIAVVPLDELAAKIKSDAQEKGYKLQNDAEMTETIGPIDGFRLRYTLQRQDILPDDPRRGGRASRGGMRVVLSRFELIPVTEPMGETLPEAMADGSLYRQALAGLKPQRSAVTLWVYPDSFADFRKLRDQLHQAGFTVAARPLADGLYIGGAPNGTKSAAE